MQEKQEIWIRSWVTKIPWRRKWQPTLASSPGNPMDRGTLLLLLSHFGHIQLFATPWIVAHQAPLSKGFPRQEYWSGLPFPSPGELLNPGVKPEPPAVGGRSFTTEPPGKPTEEPGRPQFVGSQKIRIQLNNNNSTV